MRFAVINLVDAPSVVENVVIAEAGDPVPPGYLFFANPPDWVVPGIGWDHTGFIKPVALRAGMPDAPDGLDVL